MFGRCSSFFQCEPIKPDVLTEIRPGCLPLWKLTSSNSNRDASYLQASRSAKAANTPFLEPTNA
jgi:hypothetical protein